MSPTTPIKDLAGLQIIRTRHPPVLFHEQLALINTESGPFADAADIRRRIDELPRSDRLLLAVQGEKLIGYVHLRITFDLLNDETTEVVAIIVRKSHRRQSIGRRLINAAETWARETGRSRLLMRTDVTRTEAHAFFVALGYEQISTALVFVRNLEGS